ncbi:adenylate kinase, putative [Bodo saltans]|uniref:Adenylate kinase, putative n=1 Tax=Bodo saltans TaxID=75058 RepID=A0A0S4J1F5_BODSA|nr:adenylate kinase, putative [Bodo saltans]|eukprot:CUG44331.1 adenylate kinase, putative [Bodo saltans]
MLRLLFIGAPGVGKGTYASRVAESLGLLHISSGDLLRAEVAKGSPVGAQIKEKIDQGLFVPDTLISEMISNHIQSSSAKGYILMATPATYPKHSLYSRVGNLSQAQFVQQSGLINIDRVYNLRQPYNVILAKISSRRSCADCGFGYNYANINEGGIRMEPLVPKVDGVCDKCGSNKPFVTRPDDVLETVQRRLDLYQDVTKPLEDYYAHLDKLTHFDVLGGTKQFLPKLLKLIDDEKSRYQKK